MIDKFTNRIGKMLQSVQKRTAFFYQLVIFVLQKVVCAPIAVGLIPIVFHVLLKVTDLSSAGDPLFCKGSQLLIILLRDRIIAGQKILLTGSFDFLIGFMNRFRGLVFKLCPLNIAVDFCKALFVLFDLVLQRGQVLAVLPSLPRSKPLKPCSVICR